MLFYEVLYTNNNIITWPVPKCIFFYILAPGPSAGPSSTSTPSRRTPPSTPRRRGSVVTTDHKLEEVPQVEGQRRKKVRRCQQCSKAGKRKVTLFQCDTCKGRAGAGVGLCPTCFLPFHT